MNAYANPVISVYLHLETDEEFKSRLALKVAKLHPDVRDMFGERLDNYVWSTYRMQRKLIEVVP